MALDGSSWFLLVFMFVLCVLTVRERFAQRREFVRSVREHDAVRLRSGPAALLADPAFTVRTSRAIRGVLFNNDEGRSWRFEAPLRGWPPDGTFVLEARAWSLRLGPALQTGDDAFDARWRAWSSPPSRLLTALAEPAVREHVALLFTVAPQATIELGGGVVRWWVLVDCGDVDEVVYLAEQLDALLSAIEDTIRASASLGARSG